MKKIIYLLLTVAFASTVATAQKLTEDQIPAAVVSAFKAKYPAAAKIKWEKENDSEFEAEFMLNKAEMSANFDATGKWIETETEIETANLPTAIQDVVSKDFAGYKIKEASKVENANSTTTYEVEVKKDKEKIELLLSADGQILKKEIKKKDEEDEKEYKMKKE